MASDSTAGSAKTNYKPPQSGENAAQSASRAVSNSYQQAQAATDEVVSFIRGQPVAATVIALGLGYILGRLRI
ncbi:MAG: hypothetical protein JOZ42_13665 [Acetobacteraceae bacterium]|nr:hypothetical protein [Acetobacteraceae bacterium]